VKDVDRIRQHTGVRNTSRVSFWGIPFPQYHILFLHCRQPPLKKGNSQMDSSDQDNPAAPSPCHFTLKVLWNSLLGQYSNTHFAKPFLNRHVASRAVSTSTGISGYFQPGQAKVVLGPTTLGMSMDLLLLKENLYSGKGPPICNPRVQLSLGRMTNIVYILFLNKKTRETVHSCMVQRKTVARPLFFAKLTSRYV
jgi:hypothetical protein